MPGAEMDGMEGVEGNDMNEGGGEPAPM